MQRKRGAYIYIYVSLLDENSLYIRKKFQTLYCKCYTKKKNVRCVCS